MVTRVTARKAAARHPIKDAVTGALGLSGERMSKVDTAWLRMDSSHNLMMIVGVWVIHPGVSYADVAARLQERMTRYPRFMQCAVEDAAGATWVSDPQFDIANHLVRELLPRTSQARQQALQDRLAALCMTPLDRGHPLW